MISLDNRSLLLWHRGRQDVALPTTQRTTSEEMEINLSPVKDATARRECSTGIPRVDVLESRKVGRTDRCTRERIQVGVWQRSSK
jgi:hypothetical protein